MQRMGRNPPPVIVTRARTRWRWCAAPCCSRPRFPSCAARPQELAGRLDDLVRVMTDIRTERDKLEPRRARLNDARTRLAGLMEAKRQSLAERQARARRSAQGGGRHLAQRHRPVRADRPARQDGRREHRPRRLRAQSRRSNGRSAAGSSRGTRGCDRRNGGADASRRAAGRGRNRRRAGRAGAAVAPVGASRRCRKLPIRRSSWRRRLDALGKPGRLKPAIPFHRAKGQLPMPAQGRRVLAFGERTPVRAAHPRAS